jgi:hypothetical protein
MIDDESYSAAVGPWLDRMNDETLPADIRQQLRDFDAALTKKDEVETTAEEWLDAQKSRLPDAYLAKWTAEFEPSLQERMDAATKDV